MHTQHVKFSTYVAWSNGVGVVVAVGVVFEEGKLFGLVEDDDDDRSVLEEVVVVVVFFFLPSPPFFCFFFFFFFFFFLLLLGFIWNRLTIIQQPYYNRAGRSSSGGRLEQELRQFFSPVHQIAKNAGPPTPSHLPHHIT